MLKKTMLLALTCLSSQAFAKSEPSSYNFVRINSNHPMYSLEATEPSTLNIEEGIKRHQEIDMKFSNIDAIIEDSCIVDVSSNIPGSNRSYTIKSVRYAGMNRYYNFDQIVVKRKIDNQVLNINQTISLSPYLYFEFSNSIRKNQSDYYINELTVSALSFGSHDNYLNNDVIDKTAWIFKKTNRQDSPYVASDHINGDLITDTNGNKIAVASKDMFKRVILPDDLVMNTAISKYNDVNGTEISLTLTCKDFHKRMHKNRLESLKRLPSEN